jgi:UDP-glucuronate 4-epimerase
MKRILITGGAGFIGSTLADTLLRRGDAVTIVDDFNDYYDPAIKRRNIAGAVANPGCAVIEGDICDEAVVRGAFERARPDVVVHLAARAGVRPSLHDPQLYHRVNVLGSQHILDACRTAAVSHLVFASSSSVYGGSIDTPFRETDAVARPISPYAATKRMNELMAHVYSHVYGLNVTLLRFFTAYGPRQRPDMAIHKFVALMERGEPVPMYGDGSTRRDYTYIDDIVDGVVCAVDTPFRYEIFNLGEDRTTSLRELIDTLSGVMGKPARVDAQPMQPGDVVITHASIDKARAMLGYAPRFPLEEGLRRFVAWYRGERG